jgi:hypothetical protein
MVRVSVMPRYGYHPKVRSYKCLICGGREGLTIEEPDHPWERGDNREP